MGLAAASCLEVVCGWLVQGCELVSVLTLSKRRDWMELILQCLPLSEMELLSVVMALSTNTLKARSVLAVVK